MSQEPREGIDYLVDLYAVAGVDTTADEKVLKQAINRRMREYHPDRLEGTAQEFRSKGERMAALLSTAKVILLNPEKRAEYDQILAEWDGPVSRDGTPAISMQRDLQRRMEGMTEEEIEAAFAEQVRQAEFITGYSPTRLSFLERMMTDTGQNASDDLRIEYENALLSYDQLLALQESERSQLLGLPDPAKNRFRAGLDYADTIAGQIEAAREERLEQLHMEALGGVGIRLAILSGKETETTSTDVSLAGPIELPAYFEPQAKKVRELAAKRQEVVAKRLANYRPEYPFPELQEGEAKPALVIGIGEEDFKWYGVKFDQETNSAGIQPIPEDIILLLKAGDYAGVINAGYNVLTFEFLEQIDVNTQLINALEKHAEKYGIGDE